MDSVEVRLITGCSVDGKVTLYQGASSKAFGKLLTAEMSRPLTELRSWADAVLTSRGTVDADDPSMTCAANPKLIRMVIDRYLQLRPDRKFFDGQAPTYVVTSSTTPEKEEFFSAHKIGTIRLTEEHFIQELKPRLAEMGILKVLVEGGGNLNSVLIGHGVIDRLYVAYFPFLVGGAKTPTLLDGPGIAEIGKVQRLQLVRCDVIDSQMILAQYRVCPSMPEV